MGDGDFGVNLSTGACSTLRHLDADPALRSDPAAPLHAAATAFLDEVGGTSGPLFGLLFQSLAVAVAATTPTLAAGAAEGLAAIRRVGDAAPGDKTLVDALGPAAEALRTAPASLSRPGPGNRAPPADRPGRGTSRGAVRQQPDRHAPHPPENQETAGGTQHRHPAGDHPARRPGDPPKRGSRTKTATPTRRSRRRVNDLQALSCDCFLRDHPSQYQSVQLTGGTSRRPKAGEHGSLARSPTQHKV